jgi:RNA recognition motif-containing protein
MKLWIGNLPPDASDEDLRAFVHKYTQVEIVGLIHIDGDGSRPGVLIEIDGAGHMLLMQMQRRLHRMYWKGRQLAVQIMLFSDRL